MPGRKPVATVLCSASDKANDHYFVSKEVHSTVKDYVSLPLVLVPLGRVLGFFRTYQV